MRCMCYLGMTPEQLKTKLSELGLSQVGLARLIGVSDRQVRRWVRGDTPIPKPIEMLILSLK